MATAFSSANRATWQALRLKSINPGAGSQQLQPTTGYIELGRWLGAWMPFNGFVRDLPGAPIVEIDQYAFLPPEAARIVREGDVLRNLDTQTMWKVQKVFSYPSQCSCALKSETTLPSN